jgi:hypothetical protein
MENKPKMQRVTAVTGCIFGKIIQAGKGRAQVRIERFVCCLGGPALSIRGRLAIILGLRGVAQFG